METWHYKDQERQVTMDRRVLLDTLSSTTFLQGVSGEYLDELASIAMLDEFAEGDVIFEEGDPVDDVYLLIRGTVALKVSASGIDPQQVYTVGRGEGLGWSALFSRSQRTATAVATEPTSVFRFAGEELHALCDKNPRFGYAIMQQTVIAIAKRLRGMRARFIEVYRLQPTGFICGSVEVGVD
jgi:CRP/FNR family cyclic AMP-dependent transcriptional regulator